MEIITQVIHYCLFKPTYEGSIYFYVRVQREGDTKFNWFTGRKSTVPGCVARGGGDLTPERIAELESEYQEELRKLKYYTSSLDGETFDSTTFGPDDYGVFVENESHCYFYGSKKECDKFIESKYK